MLVSGTRRLAFRQSQRLPFARNRHQASRSNIRRVSFEPEGPPLAGSISEAFAAIQEEQIMAEQGVPRFQGNEPAPPVAQNLEDPDRGFTLCERIFMIGARNFFVPNERPDSIYCIDCYKRGGFHIALILVVSLANRALRILSMSSIKHFFCLRRSFACSFLRMPFYILCQWLGDNCSFPRLTKTCF